MGKIFVVGIGPGNRLDMTARAVAALEQSDIIAGYTVYVDLVRSQFPQKACLTTPMRQEADRCRAALEQAAGGQTVALVCSGDAGVYGMAGLVYELSDQYPPVEIEVVACNSRMQRSCAAWCTSGSRLCSDLSERPSDPLGDDRKTAGCGRHGGFLYLSVQPCKQKTCRPSATGM